MQHWVTLDWFLGLRQVVIEIELEWVGCDRTKIELSVEQRVLAMVNVLPPNIITRPAEQRVLLLCNVSC